MSASDAAGTARSVAPVVAVAAAAAAAAAGLGYVIMRSSNASNSASSPATSPGPRPPSQAHSGQSAQGQAVPQVVFPARLMEDPAGEEEAAQAGAAAATEAVPQPASHTPHDDQATSHVEAVVLPLGAQDYVSQAEVFAGDATGEDFVEEDDDEENNGKEESDPAAQRFSRLRSLLESQGQGQVGAESNQPPAQLLRFQLEKVLVQSQERAQHWQPPTDGETVDEDKEETIRRQTKLRNRWRAEADSDEEDAVDEMQMELVRATLQVSQGVVARIMAQAVQQVLAHVPKKTEATHLRKQLADEAAETLRGLEHESSQAGQHKSERAALSRRITGALAGNEPAVGLAEALREIPSDVRAPALVDAFSAHSQQSELVCNFACQLLEVLILMEPQADLPAASSFKVPRLCAEICAACRKCITDRTILATIFNNFLATSKTVWLASTAVLSSVLTLVSQSAAPQHVEQARLYVERLLMFQDATGVLQICKSFPMLATEEILGLALLYKFSAALALADQSPESAKILLKLLNDRLAPESDPAYAAVRQRDEAYCAKYPKIFAKKIKPPPRQDVRKAATKLLNSHYGPEGDELFPHVALERDMSAFRYFLYEYRKASSQTALKQRRLSCHPAEPGYYGLAEILWLMSSEQPLMAAELQQRGIPLPTNASKTVHEADASVRDWLKQWPEGSGQCLRLPSSMSIEWIDCEQGLTHMLDFMRAKPHVLCALDSEWPALSAKHQGSSLALLQLAVEDKVFLVDVTTLRTHAALATCVQALFTDQKITIIAFSAKSDLQHLRKTLPSLAALRSPERVIDLEREAERICKAVGVPAKLGRSLTALCNSLLCAPLDKAECISDWTRRPLRPAQLHYAAMDAFVLLELHRRLQEIEQTKRWPNATALVAEGAGAANQSNGGPSVGEGEAAPTAAPTSNAQPELKANKLKPSQRGKEQQQAAEKQKKKNNGNKNDVGKANDKVDSKADKTKADKTKADRKTEKTKADNKAEQKAEQSRAAKKADSSAGAAQVVQTGLAGKNTAVANTPAPAKQGAKAQAVLSVDDASTISSAGSATTTAAARPISPKGKRSRPANATKPASAASPQKKSVDDKEPPSKAQKADVSEANPDPKGKGLRTKDSNAKAKPPSSGSKKEASALKDEVRGDGRAAATTQSAKSDSKQGDTGGKNVAGGVSASASGSASANASAGGKLEHAAAANHMKPSEAETTTAPPRAKLATKKSTSGEETPASDNQAKVPSAKGAAQKIKRPASDSNQGATSDSAPFQAEAGAPRQKKSRPKASAERPERPAQGSEASTRPSENPSAAQPQKKALEKPSSAPSSSQKPANTSATAQPTPKSTKSDDATATATGAQASSSASAPLPQRQPRKRDAQRQASQGSAAGPTVESAATSGKDVKPVLAADAGGAAANESEPVAKDKKSAEKKFAAAKDPATKTAKPSSTPQSEAQKPSTAAATGPVEVQAAGKSAVATTFDSASAPNKKSKVQATTADPAPSSAGTAATDKPQKLSKSQRRRQRAQQRQSTTNSESQVPAAAVSATPATAAKQNIVSETKVTGRTGSAQPAPLAGADTAVAAKPSSAAAPPAAASKPMGELPVDVASRLAVLFPQSLPRSIVHVTTSNSGAAASAANANTEPAASGRGQGRSRGGGVVRGRGRGGGRGVDQGDVNLTSTLFPLLTLPPASSAAPTSASSVAPDQPQASMAAGGAARGVGRGRGRGRGQGRGQPVSQTLA